MSACSYKNNQLKLFLAWCERNLWDFNILITPKIGATEAFFFFQNISIKHSLNAFVHSAETFALLTLKFIDSDSLDYFKYIIFPCNTSTFKKLSNQ